LKAVVFYELIKVNTKEFKGNYEVLSKVAVILDLYYVVLIVRVIFF